jgi:hypothetical protein
LAMVWSRLCGLWEVWLVTDKVGERLEQRSGRRATAWTEEAELRA